MWAQSLDYVQEHKPTVVILENVPNLVTSFATEFRHVVDNLKSSGYKAKYKVLCTAEHGIPHHRRRVHVFAIKESAVQEKFRFPKKLGWAIKFSALLHTGKWGAKPQSMTLSTRAQMIVSNAIRTAVKGPVCLTFSQGQMCGCVVGQEYGDCADGTRKRDRR